MAKWKESKGSYRYQQANFLADQCRMWGLDPDYGMPFDSDQSNFDFASMTPEEAPNVSWQAPSGFTQTPRTNGAKPDVGRGDY